MFQSKADCLVNTVNCEGYMGKGIAYQFKIQFPENNKAYVKECRNGNLKPGKVYTFVEEGITIVNFPTKDKWRENSKISYIENGLDAFLEELPKLNVKVIAIPPLGCGNGGLEWEKVRQIIESKIGEVSEKYQILIYEPKGSYVQKVKKAPKLTVSSLIIMKLKMKTNSKTKLRLQKAAYFMNVFAKEDYFTFQRHKYGPYAHAIDIIGRDIGEYQQFYNLKDTQTTYDMVYQTICSENTTKVLKRLSPAIDRATEYVNGIETDHDLEGVSTVLFLVKTMGTGRTKSQLISDFKAWSEDKASRFSEKEIERYIDILEDTEMIEKDILGCFEYSR